VGAGPDLTRYFAIRRRNLGEDWQEGLDEIEEADCLEKGRVRERMGEERRDECLQPLMVEERNRVGCTNFVRSTYIRVKSPQHRRGRSNQFPTWNSLVTCTLGQAVRLEASWAE